MAFLGILCLILLMTTLAGQLSAKANLPVVIGQLVVGVVIGPAVLNWVQPNDLTQIFSEIGVVILMFMAGLESDLHLLRRFMKPSLLVAVTGMLLPLISFFAVGELFGLNRTESLFLALIFSATSVSITVEVLKEMNRLNSREGITILGAAVADDILSVILLSLISGDTGASNILRTIISQIAFFVILIAAARWLIPQLMKWSGIFDLRVSEVLMALILCFAFSYLADLMGLSSVIGAFFSGIAIGQTSFKQIINEGIQPIGYALFIPIFFVSIGLDLRLTGLIDDWLFFTILTIIAVLSKTLGAGLGARLFSFSYRSSLMIGFGMVSRGEMALIIAQIGFQDKLLSSDRYSAVIAAIFAATLIAPFLLRAIIGSHPKNT
ncbi:cation:proton antiporter [Oenococcus kitaharae]|uniref:Na+/H+ antiporter n=1 Tax=Oenococcus kitaharae DSM 17330 TaxID=1045004 RepID=G9WG74_9LACO|nr:cation:proton antiporter [Oenococcus kitaharae]EHN59682.1 Na+/H+ antiporter [Oenococcus kitaharae DSM 17330]OEY83518.1 sodium:proton antiporter [Oenococcus kitaharae]OEY85317.1 sodium:proton antiporter [Oenococcus kitaharae]OEY86171.1 sodium:proton antiporter [Oenococcus kitaharae]